MSQQLNREIDLNEVPSSASKTSVSCSTITTAHSSSSSSSTSSSCSLSSSGSDNDGDSDNLHQPRHRHCQKSTGHFDNQTTNESNSLDLKQRETNARLRPTTAYTRTTTSSPNITKSEIHGKNVSRDELFCNQHSRDGGVLHTSSKAPSQKLTVTQTSETDCAQSSSGTNLNKSLSAVSSEQSSVNEYNLPIRYNSNTTATSLGSSYSNLSSTTSTREATLNEAQPRRILRPAPSPSPSLSTIDTNNNKNNNASTSREGLSSKRTNFSKSASGSRLVNRGRSNVCDCLTQDCGEKKHSNRRQFIEHYYNSRTQLSTGNTSTSSFNISTPLNRLSECDAITRRLLSSPIKSTNLTESPARRTQFTDVDKSRRASLGTNTMTDQVFLFSSNRYKSPETNHENYQDTNANNQQKCDLVSADSSGDNELKHKQQQGRSLSVCDEESMNPRFRHTSSNHSSNLNRATSLACEAGSLNASKRLLIIIPLFGCDIKSLEQFTKLGLILPPVIDSAVDHLLANGINSVGIFRKSGVKSRILTLRQRIEANQKVKFNEINQNNEFSIYDIADLVKMWFRELKPVPLMTKEMIKLISASLNKSKSTNTPQTQITNRGTTSQKDSSISTNQNRYVDPNLRSKIDSITTPTHRALLLRALNFLAQISSRCGANQMTSQNLAICLTPSLCETESDQNSIFLDQKALEYCIDNHRYLFGLTNTTTEEIDGAEEKESNEKRSTSQLS